MSATGGEISVDMSILMNLESLYMLTINEGTDMLKFDFEDRCVVRQTGENRWGQLGRGDSEDIGDDPDEMGAYLGHVDLGSGEIVQDVALGDEFTCVLLESATVKVSDGLAVLGRFCLDTLGCTVHFERVRHKRYGIYSRVNNAHY